MVDIVELDFSTQTEGYWQDILQFCLMSILKEARRQKYIDELEEELVVWANKAFVNGSSF